MDSYPKLDLLNYDNLLEKTKKINPEVVVENVDGTYPGNADASNYTLEDGTPLSLSEKDQKWLTLERTFKFKG